MNMKNINADKQNLISKSKKLEEQAKREKAALIIQSYYRKRKQHI